MKIALLQTDIIWNAPLDNVKNGEILCNKAVALGAELIIFPEMFTCGFSMPNGAQARENFEVGSHFLAQTAKDRQIFTLGSLPQMDPNEKLFNTALLCGPDGSQQEYQKLHLFSYGDETAHYSAGTRLLNTSIKDLRCSIFICYDLRFPLPFHQLAEQTDLYIVMANWPTPRRTHWLTLLRARAIENQAYVAGVNRVGSGGGLSYSGDSVIFAPDGTQLTELTADEAIITADIIPAKVSDWRATFPALRDRRPGVYNDL